MALGISTGISLKDSCWNQGIVEITENQLFRIIGIFEESEESLEIKSPRKPVAVQLENLNNYIPNHSSELRSPASPE